MRSSFSNRTLALVAILVGTSSVANAGPILFSADGVAADAVSIQTLNFSAGEALAVNSISGGTIAPGTTFTLYYQTVLSSVTLANGTQFNPVGLNTAYQITEVASFKETVTSVSGNTVQFTQAGGAPNTVGIYYTALTAGVAQANLSSGTGFIDPTSTTILSSTVSTENSNFTDLSKAGAPTVPLSPGSFGGTTDQGVGSSTVNTAVSSYLNNFFVTPGITASSFNTYQNTPFQFALNAGLTFTNPSGGTVTPNVGANNGTTGPDFLLQINGNQSFTAAAVPEPASVLMTVVGIGTAGFGAFAAKRRKAAKQD